MGWTPRLRKEKYRHAKKRESESEKRGAVMENEKKRVVGLVSLDEALANFANKSKENKDVLERSEKISSLISRIVDERNFMGYSQRDLAEITGIKQPMIARIERLETMPRIDTLFKLLHGVNLDIRVIERQEYTKWDYDTTHQTELYFDEANYSGGCYGTSSNEA